MINQINNISWEQAFNEIEDNSIDLLLTDPPYGINFESRHRKERRKAIKGDNNLEWLDNWVEQVDKKMKDNTHLYVFCSHHNIDIFKQALEKKFKLKNILVWIKDNHGMGDLKGSYANMTEFILFFCKGKRNLNGKRGRNTFHYPKTLYKNHPNEKPIELLKHIIENSSNKNDVVLDTFAGSFTIAKACKDKERNFLAFEIEEEYCNKAKELYG